jgi:protein-tyrosine-phosphatase
VTDNVTTVLFVCDTNECRSALAEWHFRGTLRRYGAEAHIVVSSAGIRADPGSPLRPECAAVLAEDAMAAFRSRAVTSHVLAAADAVVAMTTAELSEVLRIRPRSLPYAVTLPELARAATRRPTPHHADRADRLLQLVHWTVRHRGALTPADRQDNDIPDPIGPSPTALRATATRVGEHLDVITTRLWPAPATAATPS